MQRILWGLEIDDLFPFLSKKILVSVFLEDLFYQGFLGLSETATDNYSTHILRLENSARILKSLILGFRFKSEVLFLFCCCCFWWVGLIYDPIRISPSP